MTIFFHLNELLCQLFDPVAEGNIHSYQYCGANIWYGYI